jgi:nitrous oxidase accessory protein
MKSMNRKNLFATFAILALLVTLFVTTISVEASAKTITVPDDYPTLQAAVAKASPGDTVFVRNGRYDGGVVIDKPISLKGEDPNRTIIIGGATAQDLGLTSVDSRTAPKNTPSTITFAITQKGPTVNIQPMSLKIQPVNFIPPLTFAIIVNSDNVTISGFTIMGGDRAIYSSQGNQLQICQNSLGTCILGGSNNTVTNNSRIGLTIFGSQNLIANNSGGFVVACSNSTITDNTLSGFALQSAFSNIIINNTLSGSNMGLWIGSSISSGPPTCSYNLFAGNRIKNCGLWGILMGAGSDNVFFGNLVENTGVSEGHDGYGLAMGGNGLTAENNLFFHNIFVNNTKNFGVNWEVTGANFFDDGKEGNYWDDYLTIHPNAVHVENPETGNIPYVLIGNNIDNHPLLVEPTVSWAVPALPEPWASLLPDLSLLPKSQTSTPELTPKQTPSPSPSETYAQQSTIPTQSTTPLPSPSIPEFTVSISILSSLLAVSIVVLILMRRRPQ